MAKKNSSKKSGSNKNKRKSSSSGPRMSSGFDPFAKLLGNSGKEAKIVVVGSTSFEVNDKFRAEDAKYLELTDEEFAGRKEKKQQDEYQLAIQKALKISRIVDDEDLHLGPSPLLAGAFEHFNFMATIVKHLGNAKYHNLNTEVLVGKLILDLFREFNIHHEHIQVERYRKNNFYQALFYMANDTVMRAVNEFTGFIGAQRLGRYENLEGLYLDLSTQMAKIIAQDQKITTLQLHATPRSCLKYSKIDKDLKLHECNVEKLNDNAICLSELNSGIPLLLEHVADEVASKDTICSFLKNGLPKLKESLPDLKYVSIDYNEVDSELVDAVKSCGFDALVVAPQSSKLAQELMATPKSLMTQIDLGDQKGHGLQLSSTIEFNAPSDGSTIKMRPTLMVDPLIAETVRNELIAERDAQAEALTDIKSISHKDKEVAFKALKILKRLTLIKATGKDSNAPEIYQDDKQQWHVESDYTVNEALLKKLQEEAGKIVLLQSDVHEPISFDEISRCYMPLHSLNKKWLSLSPMDAVLPEYVFRHNDILRGLAFAKDLLMLICVGLNAHIETCVKLEGRYALIASGMMSTAASLLGLMDHFYYSDPMRLDIDYIKMTGGYHEDDCVYFTEIAEPTMSLLVALGPEWERFFNGETMRVMTYSLDESMDFKYMPRYRVKQLKNAQRAQV